MAYQLDGKDIEYFDLMDVILEALHNEIDVYYAFHMGVDLYWIQHPPDWADLVELTRGGLKVKEKLIEPFAVTQEIDITDLF